MSGGPQRKLREEDLLFWAQKVLGRAEPLVLGDFRDGVLLLRILQRVLGGQPLVAKTIGLAMHDPAGSLQERMENLTLVDAVLREHGSDGLRLSAMLTGDDSLDLEQVELGNVGAIASLLMVLYRFYCTKSTTDVRRVKVRAKNAKARPASLNTTEASATAAIAAIGPAAVQERVHGARGGAWDGWQGETVVGLLPVKETLSIVSQEDGVGAYKEKMAVLTAHACWLSVGSFPWAFPAVLWWRPCERACVPGTCLLRSSETCCCMDACRRVGAASVRTAARFFSILRLHGRVGNDATM